MAIIPGNTQFRCDTTGVVIEEKGSSQTNSRAGIFTMDDIYDTVVNPNQYVINVTQDNFESTLGGAIDSTKIYRINGIIDTGSVSIEIPATGISIIGNSFDLSGLVSSADNYTMFTSPIGGSGNLLGQDYYISVTGIGSKVYNITDISGDSALEMYRVNYNDCTSLGDMYDYRQALESGTGRFGSSPSLTLHGTWLGGYRITTSIIRSMSDTTTEPLFKAGVNFVMNSRFLTDVNCDLGTLQPLTDFSGSNFPIPSTVQFRGAIISRNGVMNALDANITPNLTKGNLACGWKGNIGIPNTFVGGTLDCDTEILTVISTQSVPVNLNGTFGAIDLQHFDSPSNGKLRHLGVDPSEFEVVFDFVLEGTANDDYRIDLVRWANGSPTTVFSRTRVVNNFSGNRDVAYYSGQTSVILNQNEYLYWQVANLEGTGNCTLELDSSWYVKER